MAVTVRLGHLPHIKWIDLSGDGVLVECAVMNEDRFGNISFVKVNSLDAVDRRRLLKIVSNRNATNFPLWDLMSNITLNNGVNALTYFHQLVEMITPTGKIMRPRKGEIGTGIIDTNAQQAEAQADAEAAERHAARQPAKAKKTAAPAPTAE